MALPLTVCLYFTLALAQNATVDLGYTKYNGRALSNGITQWLGMRYAAPPVDSLRFANPQDPVPTEGIQDADQHGPLCIPTGEYPVPDGTSEDCLFVDVYAPSSAGDASKLPVFFWIQGGGFNSNSNANYNGTGLIEASGKDIVVVTFNYRVGPYGFLAGEEVQRGGSLNNGLKDQLKALEWVQKHIAKFGGNPNHVVIGGDSAGAASITLLLSAYAGKDLGLFHAAAAESQSFATMLTVSESQFAYDSLVNRTNCKTHKDTLTCLRELDLATFQRENFNIPYPTTTGAPLYLYGPTIDNDLVADYTYALFHQGRFNKHIPVIFGDDTNEGTVFVPKNTSSTNDTDTFLRNQFPKLKPRHLRKIHKLYLQDIESQPQFPDSGPYWRAASNAYGEMRYICPGIDMSSVFARAGARSWNYHYDVRDPDAERDGTGVSHTVEVNAIWGPEYVSSPPPKSYFGSNAPIVPVMQGYWTSFIKTLDPNTLRYPGTPVWATWNGGHRLYIRTNETRMETVPAGQWERCEYLIGIGEDLAQ